MNLPQLIRSRRTIHIFNNQPVSDAIVKEALELSLWSLNHRLTFPWVYKIASHDQRMQLAELQIEEKSKKGPLSEPMKNSMRANFMNASHYVALGVKRDADSAVERENYATLACGVQIASLVLWEKEVGSKWTTSGFSMNAKTYEIFNLSPDEVHLEGGLFIGKFDQAPPASQRPSIETVLA